MMMMMVQAWSSTFADVRRLQRRSTSSTSTYRHQQSAGATCRLPAVPTELWRHTAPSSEPDVISSCRRGRTRLCWVQHGRQDCFITTVRCRIYSIFQSSRLQVSVLSSVASLKMVSPCAVTDDVR